MGEAEMVKRLLTAVLAAAFLATMAAAPVSAQTTAPSKKEASAKQMAQRARMKDCSVKWGAHKKATKESGRAAHRKFMGECLKN